MTDEILTDDLVASEPEEVVAPPSDSLESIMDSMRDTQQRMIDDGDLSQEEAIPTGEEVEPVEEVETVAPPSYLDKWNPVLTQAAGGDVPEEQKEQLVDTLMTSWVGLRSKPQETALQIVGQYIPKEQIKSFAAALLHQNGLDAYDVDVDEYAQTAPSRDVAERDQQIEMLKNQLASIQMTQTVTQLKSSGDYPLLDNQEFAAKMAKVYGDYPTLGLEGAYRFVVAQDPDLAKQAAPAVSDDKPSTRRLARKGDILPRGKPNGAHYESIPKNAVEHLKMKARELM
jgi:hypothetical protein